MVLVLCGACQNVAVLRPVPGYSFPHVSSPADVLEAVLRNRFHHAGEIMDTNVSYFFVGVPKEFHGGQAPEDFLARLSDLGKPVRPRGEAIVTIRDDEHRLGGVLHRQTSEKGILIDITRLAFLSPNDAQGSGVCLPTPPYSVTRRFGFVARHWDGKWRVIASHGGEIDVHR